MAGKSESKHADNKEAGIGSKMQDVLSRCNHNRKIQYHQIQIPGWARALTAEDLMEECRPAY